MPGIARRRMQRLQGGTTRGKLPRERVLRPPEPTSEHLHATSLCGVLSDVPPARWKLRRWRTGSPRSGRHLTPTSGTWGSGPTPGDGPGGRCRSHRRQRALYVGCGTGGADRRARAPAGGGRGGRGESTRPSPSVTGLRGLASPARMSGSAAPRACRSPSDFVRRCALPQLVVNFMRDVDDRCRRDAARDAAGRLRWPPCTWDYSRRHDDAPRVLGGCGLASIPSAPDEGGDGVLHGRRARAALAGGRSLNAGTDALVVERTYADFDDYWEPFTFGVGPAARTAPHSTQTAATQSDANASGCSTSPRGRSL